MKVVDESTKGMIPGPRHTVDSAYLSSLDCPSFSGVETGGVSSHPASRGPARSALSNSSSRYERSGHALGQSCLGNFCYAQQSWETFIGLNLHTISSIT